MQQLQSQMRSMQGDEACNLLTQITNILRLLCGGLLAQLDLADNCLWQVSDQQKLHLQHHLAQLQTRIQNAHGIVANLMARQQQEVSASQERAREGEDEGRGKESARWGEKKEELKGSREAG